MIGVSEAPLMVHTNCATWMLSVASASAPIRVPSIAVVPTAGAVISTLGGGSGNTVTVLVAVVDCPASSVAVARIDSEVMSRGTVITAWYGGLKSGGCATPLTVHTTWATWTLSAACA